MLTKHLDGINFYDKINISLLPTVGVDASNRRINLVYGAVRRIAHTTNGKMHLDGDVCIMRANAFRLLGSGKNVRFHRGLAFNGNYMR